MKTNLLLYCIVFLLARGLAHSLRANNFTKITTGSVVLDVGNSGAWGDYDGDGRLDLFVASPGGSNNSLYHNNGDGTFTKVTSGSIVTDTGGNFTGSAWGDYDNDGYPDLFVANQYQNNFLYHNNGDGTFTKITSGNVVTDGGESYGCAWGDYDKDGYLDLYVANANTPSFLYHNNGDGTFSRVTTGSIATDVGQFDGCAWGDYDNDGWLDLFVANGGNLNNVLYHNNGDGTFTRITTGAIVNDGGYTVNCAWGDYDNDGFLDMYVANRLGPNFLYHNNGNGTFTRITSGSIVTDVADSNGCSWGDYNNDGYLDLFVANWNGQSDALYQNNGDGTFTKITAGNPVNDSGNGIGCGWGDYDGDGQLDLFVANWSGQNNFLYRNEGNNSKWITIQCVGTASNREGIGARVKVDATIHGSLRSQVRQISSGNGWDGSAKGAHFGLGDATVITTLRIEWPSGTTQELHDVVPNQLLVVHEQGSQSSILTISPNGGIFTNSVSVTFSNSLGVGVIRFTLDGTVPTSSSALYDASVMLTNAAVIRVRVFVNNFPVTETVAASFARFYAVEDGLPNSWRKQYFGPSYQTDPRVQASADPDGDGATNMEEYLAGTNPIDPLSGFKVTVRAVPLVSWGSAPNSVYRILRKDSVNAPDWTTIVPAFRATNSFSVYADVDFVGPNSFYLVQPVP